jgi:hypothetical protein
MNGTTTNTNGTTTTNTNWDPTTPDVTTALQNAFGAVNVAQQIVPVDNSYVGTSGAPADIFHPDPPTIVNDGATPFVFVRSKFFLSERNNAPSVYGPKLGAYAARTLALAVDTLFFQGEQGLSHLPPSVTIEPAHHKHIGNGLIGSADHEILINPVEPRDTLNSGREILAAVNKATSVFAQKAQPGTCLIAVDPYAYAAIGASAINGNPTITVLNSLKGTLEPQIWVSPALPELSGVILSTGSAPGQVGQQPGGPLILYLGQEVLGEFITRDPVGRFEYNVTFAFQSGILDRRAIISLKFPRDDKSGKGPK